MASRVAIWVPRGPAGLAAGVAASGDSCRNGRLSDRATPRRRKGGTNNKGLRAARLWHSIAVATGQTYLGCT